MKMKNAVFQASKAEPAFVLNNEFMIQTTLLTQWASSHIITCLGDVVENNTTLKEVLGTDRMVASLSKLKTVSIIRSITQVISVWLVSKRTIMSSKILYVIITARVKG